MEQTMDQNKEMTAQESLGLISEMLNNNRRSILHDSAKHFILWGVLLTVTSLTIYLLIHTTLSMIWNWLWFAMPVLGFPMAKILSRKSADLPQNIISHQIQSIWFTYCVFAVVVSIVAVLKMPACITLILVVLLGFAATLTGFLLKNWPIIISGFILGVGGAAVALFVRNEAQLLVFTVGGLLLIVTGLIVKHQYR